MMDSILKVILAAAIGLAFFLFAGVGYAIYQVNTEKWECRETGRLTSGVRIIGKVIMPYTDEPEIKCERVK